MKHCPFFILKICNPDSFYCNLPIMFIIDTLYLAEWAMFLHRSANYDLWEIVVRWYPSALSA